MRILQKILAYDIITTANRKHRKLSQINIKLHTTDASNCSPFLA